MRKVICMGLLALSLFTAAFFQMKKAEAVYQPNYLGWINLSLATATAASVLVTTAPTIGYMIWCFDCVSGGGAGSLCISTGSSAANQFILSTGTACH